MIKYESNEKIFIDNELLYCSSWMREYNRLSDYWDDSWDARYWSNTYVTKDKILGKALFTYWPFAHFGKLE